MGGFDDFMFQGFIPNEEVLENLRQGRPVNEELVGRLAEEQQQAHLQQQQQQQEQVEEQAPQ
jgi:hypothetical protein